MIQTLSAALDRLSNFLAPRKGLLPLIGLGLVLINFILQLFPAGWLSQTYCFLHLGLVLAIVGFMLAGAL